MERKVVKILQSEFNSYGVNLETADGIVEFIIANLEKFNRLHHRYEFTRFILLIKTLCSGVFNYNQKLLLHQLESGIIPQLVEKLTWMVGRPDDKVNDACVLRIKSANKACVYKWKKRHHESFEDIGKYVLSSLFRDSIIAEKTNTMLGVETINLIQAYKGLRPDIGLLANSDYLVKLIKFAAYDKTVTDNPLLWLLSCQKYLIPLMKSGFIQVVYSVAYQVRNRSYRCPTHFIVVTKILKKLTEVAESAAGTRDIMQHLQNSDEATKINVILSIPYVIRNRDILRTVLLKCGCLKTLLDLIEDGEENNPRPLNALCYMATWLVEIPRYFPIRADCIRKGSNGGLDDYAISEDCRNVVSFVLDDGSVVEADREFLIEKSEFFNRLLNGHFRERFQNRVTLPKVNARSFKCLLRLLENFPCYKVICMDLNLETVLETITLCDRFLLPELCKTLISIVEHRISKDSFPIIYSWSLNSKTNFMRTDSLICALMFDVAEKDRLEMFTKLFEMGHKKQLLEDIRNLITELLMEDDEIYPIDSVWRTKGYRCLWDDIKCRLAKKFV
ncbi:hypothetical protein GWI33_019191 [Rhynchophorus ferrugineus]|uniref:BTB domain-containing protein n=1 Tax=Rhynchophorus ferrugineus TaxID=354439 RepID=A0A834M5J9_RHYFE|nr:hypothetical protein GWI33_019191 [Rhynchophorus ferrugineus]